MIHQQEDPKPLYEDVDLSPLQNKINSNHNLQTIRLEGLKTECQRLGVLIKLMDDRLRAIEYNMPTTNGWRTGILTFLTRLGIYTPPEAKVKSMKGSK